MTFISIEGAYGHNVGFPFEETASGNWRLAAGFPET